MALQLGMTIDGVKEVLQGFSRLAPGLQKKYLKSSVNKVTKPHVSTVKSLIARGPTGNLKRSVGVVTEAKVKGRTQTAVLGFRRGDKAGENGVRSGYHAWWIENGVKARAPKFRQALHVPVQMARRYKYLKGKITLAGDAGGGAFFRQVNGFAGTGKFAAWADSTLPSIRDALQTELASALGKATDEAARRARKGM